MRTAASARRRLDKLDLILRPAGCDHCRAWIDTVLADDQGNRSRPETCPGCGRHVPYRVVIEIIGVPVDAI